jgi:hypothetical protein
MITSDEDVGHNRQNCWKTHEAKKKRKEKRYIYICIFCMRHLYNITDDRKEKENKSE